MKNIIELVWKKQEEKLADYTVYKAFANDVEVEYVIMENEQGVHLGASKSDGENVKTHAFSPNLAYPHMDDYTLLNFERIPDKIGFMLTKVEKPNSGTINGSKVEISALEIAKMFAQNMFNKKVETFRKMMYICG